jgi:hypothetical protein
MFLVALSEYDQVLVECDNEASYSTWTIFDIPITYLEQDGRI